METTDEGHTVYCTPDELHQVGKVLEERFGQASTMQILWRPKLEVPIDEDAGGKLLRMIDALEDSDDVQQVVEIETSTYEFPWTIGIFRDCLRVGYCCVVLEGDEEIMGYGVMSMSAGEAHLLNLCIKTERQRCGLGRDMLNFLLDRAREAKAERMIKEFDVAA